MSKDLNKVQLTGRLGADPEMRFTPQGSAVTTFRVASNRSWKTADGQAREDTEWFSVVAWNKLAEICNEYLKKGSRVYVEGRLQTRSWDDQNTGEKRYKTEVIANDLIILDSRRGDMVISADDEPDYDDVPATPAPAPARSERAPERAPARAPERVPERAPEPVAARSSAPARGTGRNGGQAPAPSRKPVVMEEEDLPF